ncbi:MAG: arginase family protein, partial [Clostridiales bacterium]|nr:arginase family protein [Clostridiales bacterium]
MLKNNEIQKCEGIYNTYDESDIVIFGIPFDKTASYKKGARLAPAAIRREMDAIETYSPYQDKDMTDYSFCDLGDIVPSSADMQTVLQKIKEETTDILKDNKKIVMLGGEHLVSYPVIDAYLNV